MTMVLKSFSVTLSVLGRAANATYAPSIGDARTPTLVVSVEGATVAEAQGVLAFLERATPADARTALLEGKKDDLTGLAKEVEAALPKPTAGTTTTVATSPGASANGASKNGAPKPKKEIKIVVEEAAQPPAAAPNGAQKPTTTAEDKVKAAAQVAAKATPPAAAPQPPAQDELEEDDAETPDPLDAMDAALESGTEAPPQDVLTDELTKATKPSAIFRHLFGTMGMSLDGGTAFLVRNKARLPFFDKLSDPEIANRAKTAHSAVAPKAQAQA